MTTNKTIKELAEEYAPLEAGYSDYDYELHQTFLAGAKAQKELSDKRESELMAVIKRQQKTLEFYGEKRLYVNLGIERELYDDSGGKARTTLQETKEELEKMGIV